MVLLGRDIKIEVAEGPKKRYGSGGFGSGFHRDRDDQEGGRYRRNSRDFDNYGGRRGGYHRGR